MPRLIKTVLALGIIAWAITGPRRRPTLPPVVTLFVPDAFSDHAPGGMGAAYSYYRED